MFEPTPEDQVDRVLDRVHQCRARGVPIDLTGLPSQIVVTPKPKGLPRALQPWSKTLTAWRKTSDEIRKASFLLMQAWQRRDEIAIRSTVLPPGFGVHLISVGVDPGPEVGSKGHTGLLLVATPPGWKPPLRASLWGPFGEVQTVRLDSLIMRVPTDWWDVYAMGALTQGCLYFIPYPPKPRNKVSRP